MSEMSLMHIMRDDPDFGRRISKKVAEIKNDKENLLSAADNYGKRYQEEIMEGTELRARLLTEGASAGLTEDEAMARHGRFVPTVYTPILNLLYFMLRESERDPYYGEGHYQQRNRLNEQFGHLREEEVSKEVMGTAPQMEEFLYGNITLDAFEKIKKLKALATSENIEEATLAFQRGREMCKKYNLDWDRIPCYLKGKDGK